MIRRLAKGPRSFTQQRDLAAVVEVPHPDHAGQRQGAMGRAECVHVEDFAIGGAAAVELPAVPRRDTGLDIAVIDRRAIGDSIDRVGQPDLVAPARRLAGPGTRCRATRGLRAGAGAQDQQGCRGRAQERRPATALNKILYHRQASTHYVVEISLRRSDRQGCRPRSRRSARGSISGSRGSCCTRHRPGRFRRAGRSMTSGCATAGWCRRDA